MELKEAMKAAPKELLLPEIGKIREENTEIKVMILAQSSERLDDINLHLADQSWRINDVRTELALRIDETSRKSKEDLLLSPYHFFMATGVLIQKEKPCQSPREEEPFTKTSSTSLRT